jgi:hypothetical protein
MWQFGQRIVNYYRQRSNGTDSANTVANNRPVQRDTASANSAG